VGSFVERGTGPRAIEGGPVVLAAGGGGPVYWVRVWSVLLLVDLSIQYLVGMYVNLFVVLPASWSWPAMMGMMAGSGSGALMLHMMNGYLLGLLAIVSLPLAMMSRRADLMIWSTAGFLGVALAGISGLEFMFTGFSVNAWSFLIASGALLSLVSYLVVAIVSGPESYRSPLPSPSLGP
jgi:hypothetical protein